MDEWQPQDILVEVVSALFEENPSPTPEDIAEAITNHFGLEQEWAVAEYGADGKLDSVGLHGYDFSSVYQKFCLAMQRNEMGNDVVGRGIGIVSRLFTHWSKV